jgi:hypothetical protein
MTLPPPKICQRRRALHSMLGSPNAKEAQTARDKLLKLLTEHGLSWNDLPAIIAATAAADTSSSRAGAAAAAGQYGGSLSSPIASLKPQPNFKGAERAHTKLRPE